MSDALAAIPVFGGLDEEGLSNLSRGMRIRRFRRGETVFHVGDPGDALLATMAAEVRRLTHHVEELHFLDITGRLASRLARLANESGATPQPDGSIRLAGPLTQGDLAAMIGCTRQSVNKLLGMFTDDGLIRLERDRIVVLNLDGLLHAAHR